LLDAVWGHQATIIKAILDHLQLGPDLYDDGRIILDLVLEQLSAERGGLAAEMLSIQTIANTKKRDHMSFAPSSSARPMTQSPKTGTSAEQSAKTPRAFKAVIPAFGQKQKSLRRASMASGPHGVRRQQTIIPMTASEATFFSPGFISHFGGFLLNRPGKYEARGGAEAVPLDAASYLATLAKLDAKDPLYCDAYRNLKATLDISTLTDLSLSTKKQWLAYDLVETVATATKGASAMRGIYIARGQPELWQPWTKADHRRVLLPGVWAARRPKDESAHAFWSARRQFGLVHSVPNQSVEEMKKDDDDQVIAHFYADLFPEAVNEHGDGIGSCSIHELQVMNTHLGKAGGLNFGLEALLHTPGMPPPTLTNPWIFGIVDARHAFDERFWVHVMPAFFEYNELIDRVYFNPDVVLCQVPHSYLGITSANDKLDQNNNYFFSGMALFRDRCDAMTSAGTGGTWAITSKDGISDYFYGRTMIEDTTSTHKYLLEGFYTRYIPPLRSPKQLMRGIPKVGANYLDALERWDQGAIQSLMSQGLPRRWFWITFGGLLAIGTAIVLPAFSIGWGNEPDFLVCVRDPFNPRYRFHNIVHAYSAFVFVGFLSFAVFCGIWAPKALNWALRHLVIFFNVSYPFTTIFGLLWAAIPPWIVITDQFPFALNAVNALLISLAMKLVEFNVIAKLQSMVQLDENAIAMTSRMDKVAVPIKLRAIWFGLQTGWADIKHKKDNSFWISFGGDTTIRFVRLWLQLLVGVMAITVLIAALKLVIYAFVDSLKFYKVVMPLAFAMASALNYIGSTLEPFRYLVVGQHVGLMPRWAEFLVMIAMLVGFIVLQNRET